MAKVVDLVVWGRRGTPAPWPCGDVLRLPDRLPDAVSALDRIVEETTAEWLLLWDPQLGAPDVDVVAALVTERADVWHSGLCFGLSGEPEEHD